MIQAYCHRTTHLPRRIRKRWSPLCDTLGESESTEQHKEIPHDGISIGELIVKTGFCQYYPTITPLSLHCLHTPCFLYATSMTFSLCFSSPPNKNDRQRWRFFCVFAVSLPCIIVALPLFPCPCGCKQFRRR